MIELRKHKLIRKLCSSSAVQLGAFGMFAGSAGFLLTFVDPRLDPSKAGPVLVVIPGSLFVGGLVADIVGKFSKDTSEPDQKIDIIYVISATIIYITCGIMSLFFMDQFENWPEF